MKSLNFNKMNGLVPAIIQEENSNKVLMLGFMDKSAYKKTTKEKVIYFWSRTRNKLWKKGEESGNILYVKSINVDCDKDSLLFIVKKIKIVCHKGNKSCFEEDIL